MKDSGNIKVYLIKGKCQAMLAHGPFIDYYKIYVPAPYSAVIERSIEDNGRFFYKNDRQTIDFAEKRIQEHEGDVHEAEMDVDDITALLGLGKKMENAKKEFDSKAKSLFDIVTEKVAGGCCS